MSRLLAILFTAVLILALMAGGAHAHGQKQWVRLSHCESTHRWHIDDGGLQIINSTWRAYGGLKYAADAGDATRWQQKDIARNIAYEGYGQHGPQGRSAWACAWYAW